MGVPAWPILRWPQKRGAHDRFPIASDNVHTHICGVPAQCLFHEMIRFERKRTERSRRPFLLMLVNIDALCENGQGTYFAEKVLSASASSKRETDLMGWYLNDSTIGVIFTEIGDRDHGSIERAILDSFYGAVRKTLGSEEIKKIQIAFHFFPEQGDPQVSADPGSSALYPDLTNGSNSGRTSTVIKRTMDLGGSIIGLLVLSPILLLIVVLIKLSSPGPVLVRQRRLGRLGKPFVFYKFRSMYVDSGHDVHREYVKRFIAGGVDRPSGGSDGRGTLVYKMKTDPRITPIGGFLRKTSLDELPQLLNVLRGEMSLVGPRPPLPYEVECYDLWHRGRVLEAKPGITGLWQVKGRSRTTFDEMVRLDMKYIREWSLWLDLRILLQTPWAVLGGRGAY